MFRRTYKAARSGALADVPAILDELAGADARSAELDLDVWGGEPDRCAFWECCHPEDARSARGSRGHLRQYLVDRTRWMDENIDRPFSLL